MVKNPTVSVIIPTFNRANLIEKAIKSVLKQTYQDFEIIVVDDGSIDNTEEIIRGFKDKRVKYIKKYKKNRGISVARNIGIKVARGKYIALLDSDDEWLPEKLNKQMKIFESESSEVGVVYTGDYYVNEKDKEIKKVHIPRKKGYIYEDLLKAEGGLYVSTVLVKKECFAKVGLFDENFPAREDLDMWIRIAKYYKFRYVKDLLVVCRTHLNQITTNSEALIEGVKRIQMKYIKELRERPYSYSIRFFYLGNKLCHIGKIREGQRYFIKAILIYPFCVKYYIYMLSSFFGIKGYFFIAKIRRYLIKEIKR
jgi:glycosyltransferase involved in cell wall biosynthesis